MDNSTYIPATFEHCDHIKGPFYHGTKADLSPGDLLVPGHGSNFEVGRISNHIYFSATLEAAVWGAELAKGDRTERIYIVEPIGPFEDDPNLTNKRFPGNITQSYRTQEPLRVTGEITDWTGHPPEVLQAMLDRLAEMQRQGTAMIED